MAKPKRGGRAGSETATKTISPALQKHFDKENARVEEFMAGRVDSRGASITMDNGQILERYSLKEMTDILKEQKGNGSVFEDDAFAILYKDGSVKAYVGGDDLSKVKTTGIQGIIYENSSTSGYAGTGVKIENLNETEAFAKLTRYGTSKLEDDWRLEFEDIYYLNRR